MPSSNSSFKPSQRNWKKTLEKYTWKSSIRLNWPNCKQKNRIFKISWLACKPQITETLIRINNYKRSLNRKSKYSTNWEKGKVYWISKSYNSKVLSHSYRNRRRSANSKGQSRPLRLPKLSFLFNLISKKSNS